jgi:hypothetical protein
MKLIVIPAILISKLLASVSFGNSEKDVERQCIRQMRRIFEAAQAYRRSHEGAYPERLAQLVASNLIREELAICPRVLQGLPYSARPGGTWSSGREGLDPGSAYQYELSSLPIPASALPNGVVANWRQLKSELAVREGWEDVPVLRCERHSETEERLNVTFSGHSYRSSLLWEELFVNSVPYSYRTPYLVFRRTAPPFPRHPDSESRPAGSVNLDAAANAIPDDPWWWGNRVGPEEELAATLSPLVKVTQSGFLRRGDGVFDVRSLVQVQGAVVPRKQSKEGFTVRCFPVRREIILNGPFVEAEVICGTVWADTPGTIAGELVWHYRNGRREILNLVFGENIECFRLQPRSGGSAKPFWSGIEEESPRLLYKVRWSNPQPRDIVSKVEFIANIKSPSSPFIVAMNLKLD